MKIMIGLLAALVLAAFPAAASALPPGATTGTATDVNNGGATLNGVVNPNKTDTTWWFEYGTTTAYGAKTADQIASGNAGKEVSAAISGLLANTTYHFRLVAQNPDGRDEGNDATFTTGSSPYALPVNTITITAVPNPVTFGRSTVVSGTVGGPNNAGVTVDLEQTPAPFTAPFTKTGLSAVTDANGAYSFTVAPTVNVRYQTVAKTSPPVTSPALQVGVRKRVTFRVNDSRIHRGQRVRFFGTVKPAHDGVVARIQRRTKTKKWRTVARTKLRASKTAGQSRYSKRMRVYRTGVYRVRVPADADHLLGTSRKRKITVS
jgi:hypothetical protein